MMESEVRLPRVLVIASTPFSQTKNNGKTLSSFFEKYDCRAIAQFSFSGGDCNEEVCDKYFFLTKDDVLGGRQGTEYKADEIEKRVDTETSARGTMLRRLFHALAQARLPIAVLLKDLTWKRADYSKAMEWIDRFVPDLVFFQGFSMAYGYDFALDVCTKRKIPLILELTDDYTHRLYPLSLIGIINQARYMRVFKKALELSSKTIVISDLMKEEYEARFGGNMDVMMNAVNAVEETSDVDRDAHDFVYAGNLLLNRWKVLKNLGRALLRVDPRAKLNIYTPDVPPERILKKLSKVGSISYGGRLTKEELNHRLKKCGYVVHVEAFDKKNRKITRLSMSTKISEYAASGANILAIGPADVASMRCIAENHLGICVNTPTVDAISVALASDVPQEERRKRTAEFVSRCASASNGERLLKYITDAVSAHQGK